MRLNAPKKVVFWISVIVFVIGMLGVFGALPIGQLLSAFIVLIGYVLLLLGNIVKGM